MRGSNLRVLEDFELDHVSGGLTGGEDFVGEVFPIPAGFTAENISGVTLVHDLMTDTWTAEFVFEDTFTESGYSDAGGDGPRLNFDEPINGVVGSSELFDGGALNAGRGGGRVTTTTKVTTTKTGPSATVSIGIPGFFSFTFGTGGTNTVTETTSVSTTHRMGRITQSGKTGSTP